MFVVREKYIRKLIRLVEESAIGSLEVSSWGRTVKITHSANSTGNGSNAKAKVVQAVLEPEADGHGASFSTPVQTAKAPESPVEDTSKLLAIKSPMVGTFYAAPSPEADPYVSVNQKINVGQVVCIVEAMKLMNEIESEYSGRIVKILAENGKPVEYGQDLFLVEPD